LGHGIPQRIVVREIDRSLSPDSMNARTSFRRDAGRMAPGWASSQANSGAWYLDSLKKYDASLTASTACP
jgi:hypothetical protein